MFKYYIMLRDYLHECNATIFFCITFSVIGLFAASLHTSDELTQWNEAVCEIQNCTLNECKSFLNAEICYTSIQFNLINSNYSTSEIVKTLSKFHCDKLIPCYYSSIDVEQTLSLSRPMPYGKIFIIVCIVIITILSIILRSHDIALTSSHSSEELETVKSYNPSNSDFSKLSSYA